MNSTVSDEILYLCEAGVVTGFGHLTRQSALLEAAPQGSSIINACVLDDNEESFIRANELSEWDFRYLSSLGEFRLLDIDSRTIFVDGIRIEIDSLNLKDVELCVVTSPLLRTPRYRTASFFRGEDMPSEWTPKKGDIVELGVKYCVVSNQITNMRKDIKTAPKITEENLVVTLMLGESPDKVSRQVVMEMILELAKSGPVKVQVSQQIFEKMSSLFNFESRYLIDVVKFAPKNPWPQVMNSNIVVTSAGQAMVESMCLGFPTIAIPVHQEQSKFVRGMQARGAVIPSLMDDGTLGDLSEIAHEARDFELLEEVSKNAMHAVDGFGAKRIHEIVSAVTK